MKRNFATACIILCVHVISFGNSGEPNSRGSDANAVEVKQLAAQALKATEKAVSYHSRLMILDYTEEKLKECNYVSIQMEFSYEKPNRFEVYQASLAEKVFDHWISIGKKHYSEISETWFEDTHGHRGKTNEWLAFDKYRPLLKGCTFTYGGIEPFGNNECFVIKGKLNASAQNDWHIPKGTFDSEVSFSILKDTKQIAKVSVRVRGTGEDGAKVDSDIQQWYREYNAKFNIQKPKDVAG